MPVLTEASPCFLFFSPHLMDTPCMYLVPLERYFQGVSGQQVTRHTDHFPWKTSEITWTLSWWYIVQYPYPLLETFLICTFPLWHFKFYCSYPSILEYWSSIVKCIPPSYRVHRADLQRATFTIPIHYKTSCVEKVLKLQGSALQIGTR